MRRLKLSQYTGSQVYFRSVPKSNHKSDLNQEHREISIMVSGLIAPFTLPSITECLTVFVTHSPCEVPAVVGLTSLLCLSLITHSVYFLPTFNEALINFRLQ